MKIYLATKYELRDQYAPNMMAALRRAGHEITHDWTGEEDQSVEGLERAAAADLAGVRAADVLVIHPVSGCQGAWVEFGVAVERGIPIIMFDPDCKTCVFEFLPAVRWAGGMTELLVMLTEIECAAPAVTRT